MSDVNVYSFPLEVIEIILSFLPSADILHFSQTCRIFRKNIKSLNSLWMKKLHQEWPDFRMINKNQPSWYKLFINSCETRNFCWKKMKTMNTVSIPDAQLRLFWNKACEYDGLGFIYITSLLKKVCLMDIYYSDEICGESIRPNLTYQYFSAIILDYLSQIKLKRVWTEYCNDKEHLTPERVWSFLSRWIEPKYDNSEEFNHQYFSTVVQSIERLLPKDHPYFKVDKDIKASWSRKLLKDNVFETRVCRELIKLIREVLKSEEELIVSSEPTYYSMIFHNATPKKNSNNILSLIYFDAILRRFGVKCEPMFFHSHHLLLWRESWSLETPIFLVDSLHDRLNVSERRCPYSSSSQSLIYSYNSTSLLLTLTTHVKNISNFPNRSFNNSVELLHYLQPQEIEHLMLLSNIYLDTKKDVNGIRSKLSNILKAINHDNDDIRWRTAIITLNKLNIASLAKSPRIDRSVKLRSKSLKYAIGMVCFHKVYGYYCVIRGWDNVCSENPEWKSKMGISTLTFGENQPFYQVVAVDFSNRYVAEENLVQCNPPIRMKNIEEILALDFSHFNGFYYIPTTEKELEYPNDASIRSKYKETWQ